MPEATYEELKESHRHLINALNTLAEDCRMALDGTWDKSDSGFEDMLTLIEGTLEKAVQP